MRSDSFSVLFPRALALLLALAGHSVALAADGDAAVCGSVTFEPAADEAKIAERFRLQAGSFDWQAVPLGADSPTVEVWNVTFPSPVVTPFPANNTVHCEYFQPRRAGKRPAVIVLHILGGDFPLSRLFCNRLAQQGVAALFVKMPYYGPRRGEGISRRMISVNPDETVEGMTQAVLDIRRATAWLAARDEVDADQIGIFGISLGGITGALAATAEPRIQNVCLLLAGGDLKSLDFDSPELRKVRGELPKNLGDPATLVKKLAVIDPVTYATGARGKRILMLNADRDEVIPRVCTEALYKAFGEPEIVWYSGTHYSVIRHLFGALDRVANFFAAVDGASVPQSITRAASPPTIDGRLDDACWRDAKTVLVNRPLGRAGRFVKPCMTVRLAWDDDYLYCGYELPAVHAAADTDPRNVELFISTSSSEQFWHLRQHGAALETALCRVPPTAEWVRNGPAKLADVTIDSQPLRGSIGKSAGQTGEIRVPLGALRARGSASAEPNQLSILATLTCGGGDSATCCTSGELPKQPPHFSASRWPRYKLIDKPESSVNPE